MSTADICLILSLICLSRNVLNVTDYLACFMRSYHVVYKISLSNHLRRKDQNAINELTVAHVCNMVTKIGVHIALAQMMACCLMAPSFYLHQYYRIIHMIAIANGIFRISISKASLKRTFVKKKKMPHPPGAKKLNNEYNTIPPSLQNAHHGQSQPARGKVVVVIAFCSIYTVFFSQLNIKRCDFIHWWLGGTRLILLTTKQKNKYK